MFCYGYLNFNVFHMRQSGLMCGKDWLSNMMPLAFVECKSPTRGFEKVCFVLILIDRISQRVNRVNRPCFTVFYNKLRG